jgi:DNA-binding response OmpR family regulator
MARLLLLDGYDESRDALTVHLRGAGYDVEAVAEEDDAVRALEREGVDIVLLDLPLTEAEEAANALRGAACVRWGTRTASITFFSGPVRRLRL